MPPAKPAEQAPRREAVEDEHWFIYHLRSDTPDTLDYAFLRSVGQLLTATVIEQAQDLL